MPLQKLPTNVGDLGNLIVAKGFEKLPKVHQIDQSGHTGYVQRGWHLLPPSLFFYSPPLWVSFSSQANT